MNLNKIYQRVKFENKSLSSSEIANVISILQNPLSEQPQKYLALSILSWIFEPKYEKIVLTFLDEEQDTQLGAKAIRVLTNWKLAQKFPIRYKEIIAQIISGMPHDIDEDLRQAAILVLGDLYTQTDDKYYLIIALNIFNNIHEDVISRSNAYLSINRALNDQKILL